MDDLLVLHCTNCFVDICSFRTTPRPFHAHHTIQVFLVNFVINCIEGIGECTPRVTSFIFKRMYYIIYEFIYSVDVACLGLKPVLTLVKYDCDRIKIVKSCELLFQECFDIVGNSDIGL